MSQKFLVALTLLGLVFGLSGCGNLAQESVGPLRTGTMASGMVQDGPVVAVLPFADYSRGQTPDDYLRRQIKLHEAVSYYLARHGYLSPVREDTTQCLLDLGIIRLVDDTTTQRHIALMDEIGRGWSEDMRQVIQSYIAINEVQSGPKVEITKIGLNQQKVRSIGRKMDADYLLRGRIVEYEMRNEQTLNPFKRGLLPFFFDATSQLTFGVADSETYDLLQDMAIGGGLGALIGAQQEHPFNPPRKEQVSVGHPLFGGTAMKETGGYDDWSGLNATFWGGIGAGAAYLAKHGGQVPQAVVQVSMALQDAHTGGVVWKNRAEVAVAPVSAWADQAPRSLIDRAVEVAAEKLIEELSASLAGYSRVAAAPQITPAAPAAPPAAPVTKEEIPAGQEPQGFAPETDPMMWGS